MAPRSASVHIPQPCAESWAAMTPRGPGRHCAACQKTVVDFTQKTDAEILSLLKQATGRTCGRFAAGQLDRPLVPLAVGAPSRWRAWLAAAVAVWGLREGTGAAAKAQAVVEQGPGAMEQKADKVVVATPAAVVVRGVVLDSATHQGLPGVTVLLAGTTVGTSTDYKGHFGLEIPDSAWQVSRRLLSFRTLGFTIQKLPFSSFSENMQVLLVVSQDPKDMETIIMGGVTPRKPYPWHSRRFYYWLTQPFRRG